MQPIRQDATAKRRPTAFGGKSHEVASLPGLEPGTYCLEGSCSVQLSYRDVLAIQLPSLHTIHPENNPRRNPTHTGFLRVHCNISLMAQQVHHAHATSVGLAAACVNGGDDYMGTRSKSSRLSQVLGLATVAGSIPPPAQCHGRRAISCVDATKDSAQQPGPRTFWCDSSPSGAPLHG